MTKELSEHNLQFAETLVGDSDVEIWFDENNEISDKPDPIQTELVRKGLRSLCKIKERRLEI